MLRQTLSYLLLTLALPCADAAALHLRVLDKTGAAFPDVLVIVKSLEGKGEVFRALTDAAGGVPGRELSRGLYRAIATCPYGICQTKIVEFLVKDPPVHLTLEPDILPTQGNKVEIGPPNPLRIEAVDSQGAPARLAEVLVRDSKAHYERWYKMQADGSATVEAPEGPITIVVFYKGVLTAETVSTAAVHDLQTKGGKFTVHLK